MTTKPSAMVEALVNRHPLQRLESPSRTFSAIVHIGGLISFIGSYRFLIVFESPISKAYGWHFQYLTIIGLTLATITFTFGILSDLTLSSKLFAWKNVFSVASAPMEILIATLYWGISAIDKTLVVPPELEIDMLNDLMFHAFPAIFLFVDLMLLSPPWTIKPLPAFTLAGTLAVTYWFWIDTCYRNNGFYPYPLFAAVDTSTRAIIFTISGVMMGLSTLALQWAYSLANGVENWEEAGAPYKPHHKSL